MVSPQQASGDEAMADVNVKMVTDILTNVLPIYGVHSDKGKALMDILKKLSSTFGVETSKAGPAVPAEVAAMISAMKGSPGAPPPSPITGGQMPPTMPPAPGV